MTDHYEVPTLHIVGFNREGSWQGGSVGKGACHQKSCVRSQDSHGGRKTTPADCPLPQPHKAHL